MAASTTALPSVLPPVPAKHADFIAHVAAHPDTPLNELLEPYKQYDAKLREIFAQEPEHKALEDKYLNVVPVYEGRESDIKMRARDLENEDEEEQKRYIMPLDDADRRPSGSPAIVQSLKEFQQNFGVFCESSLVDLDWSNVVVAGSSVVTCLLPVPDKYKHSKRALRQYYHETVAPASDVDLFLYGLGEEEATKKIIEIEQRIKDSILTETTTIRTKNAITIASQYPTRHIQIVLRIYKSVSEILTGFDVDCSCAAYDGKQVWVAPRALTAYMTQVNTIDLTRRSPSYENRLSKYSRRGFEVYWPLLNRDRIDPTIFERNFARTVGLARLLVLERMPQKDEREAYMDQRRRERGRPEINRLYRHGRRGRHGNIKEKYEDEVAEWVSQEDVSDYHTFTIPYGPKYHAKKIEKLLYTKDLLLNAEWNKKDREVNLHRHPAFFGYAKDIIHDCCGFCPKPVTPEEHDVAEEEAKVYVSGEISFIKDDPGRQAIGSFNPITDADWTEMAYIGNTARLCQAIIDRDVDHVKDWLSQESADPNCRDYTGRTPLHLAVMQSSAEVVRVLIDSGARLVARIADGRTALHLAAARGDVEIVKLIMDKSEANEEEEAAKEDIRKKARMAARNNDATPSSSAPTQQPERAEEDVDMEDADEDTDMEVIEEDEAESEDDDGPYSTTTGSFVKVKEVQEKVEEFNPEAEDDEPDFYDINVLTWDTKCSPLHYAILGGHIDVVKELVQNYGADVLLPVKLLDLNKTTKGAILTLVLALNLPLEKAKAMTKTLLELGASCAQADVNQTTALHYVSIAKPELVDILVQHDEPAAKRAINHLACTGSVWNPFTSSPLMSAICNGNAFAALKLLEIGAAPRVEYEDWFKTIQGQWDENQHVHHSTKQAFYRDVEQPIVLAVQNELPEIASRLLELGVDPNTLSKESLQSLDSQSEQSPLPKHIYALVTFVIWLFFLLLRCANMLFRVGSYGRLNTILDLVRQKIEQLKDFVESQNPYVAPYILCSDDTDYLAGFKPGSYKWFVAKTQLEAARELDKKNQERYEKGVKERNEIGGIKEKQAAMEDLCKRFMTLEQQLVEKGAKPSRELYPERAAEDFARRDIFGHTYSPPKPAPFAVEFTFAPAMTDELREAYVKLFEAAWDGDLDTIKSLTLAPWGNSNNTPLKITATDGLHFSPFHIAVLRGHRDVARALVQISMAQYKPQEEDKPKTYRIEEGSDEEDSDSEEFAVYGEVVDDKFTIENIGEVSTIVKSKCSPLTFMDSIFAVGKYAKHLLEGKKWTYGIDDREIDELADYNSLQSWAIVTNDKDMFTFLLDLDLEWTDRLAKRLDDSSGIPSFSEQDFQLAIRYGRIEMLAEMIKHGGAGMELSSLVKKSGVKYREKPKFYQGLSVHGKKRADWIQAARGTYTARVTESKPPLLRAAFMGNLQAVEWFLSDTPARHYLDFAEAYKDDKMIKHLNENAGGFEKVLRKWLDTRRELVLHCAVMAPERPETLKLIRYLIEAVPESLETKSVDGYTPLSLAFALRHLDAAKILIEAGADQSVRDYEGNNIIHHLLCPRAPTYRSNKPISDSSDLLTFLKLIDTRLIPSLLAQRSSRDPGSLTPLANFLRWNPDDTILRTLLDFAQNTRNEHLELLDASGDTPLHYAVKSLKPAWLSLFLEFRPDLFHRENAVGITPVELAQDAYTAECVARLPGHWMPSNSGYWRGGRNVALKDRDAKEFAPGFVKPETVDKQVVWSLCRDFADRHPAKRRLVSLLEANEVAKRLAGRQRKERARLRREQRTSEEGSEAGGEQEEREEKVVKDEVSFWLDQAGERVWWEDQAHSLGMGMQMGYVYR